MTDMIELAQRVCMGEHVPPLKDGANPMAAFDAVFGPHLARADAQSRKIAEAARLAREAEDGDVEPWSTT
jgi:hypothetical protein